MPPVWCVQCSTWHVTLYQLLGTFFFKNSRYCSLSVDPICPLKVSKWTPLITWWIAESNIVASAIIVAFSTAPSMFLDYDWLKINSEGTFVMVHGSTEEGARRESKPLNDTLTTANKPTRKVESITVEPTISSLSPSLAPHLSHWKR